MSEQTKKVNLELEIDTNMVDSSKNRYQGLIDLAKAVDQWRIFPRLFLSVYIYLLYKITIWFMALQDPTMAQSGLVSIVVGAGIGVSLVVLREFLKKLRNTYFKITVP